MSNNNKETIVVNGKAITPTGKDDVQFDFEDKASAAFQITGVRFAKTDNYRNVIQVRIVANNASKWVTVADAICAGYLPEDAVPFTGVYSKAAAVVKRVEMYEALGLEIPMGVAISYAAAKRELAENEHHKRDREAEIVANGKEDYQNKARDNAGKRFDKIAERVNARKLVEPVAKK